MGDESKPVTPERIMQFAWGYSIPLMIEAAVKHRIFDALDAEHRPMTAAELAKKTGTSERGVRMICNAMASVELMKKDGVKQTFTLSPDTEKFLVSTKPSFQGGLFKHISRQLIPKWLSMDEIVKTGQPSGMVNEQEKGAEFFANFVEDIFPLSYGPGKVLGESLGLKSATSTVKVLDIASGSGVWGIALAQQSSQVRVTAVDWAGVIPVTRRVAQKYNVGGQFSFIEGDINTVNLGSAYNLATLGHILHSEGAARSRGLIRRVFDALAPGGTIAIAEFLANDDRTGPPQSMIFAVNMMVNTDQGDTFTFPEIAGWLKDAGFTNARSLEAPGPSPLILADKPR